MKKDAICLASTIWSLLAIGTASPQLLVDMQPELVENFQLFAHAYPSKASTFGRSIESWEVTAEPRNCNCLQSLILSKPPTNGTSAAKSFYFNPHSLSVQSGSHEAPRGMVLSRKNARWALKLVPGHRGTSNLGVALKPDGPQLHHPRGRFYACEAGEHSDSTVDLLWRHENDSGAPFRPCVEVSLFATRTEGPPHGSSSIVAANMDVRDGRCIYPMR